MKSKRTIRTLRRAGLDPRHVGFAGFTPTGKYIRRMAHTLQAQRRLIAGMHELDGSGTLVREIFARHVRDIIAVKLATKVLRAARGAQK